MVLEVSQFRVAGRLRKYHSFRQLRGYGNITVSGDREVAGVSVAGVSVAGVSVAGVSVAGVSVAGGHKKKVDHDSVIHL